jgi:hypothetical protein
VAAELLDQPAGQLVVYLQQLPPPAVPDPAARSVEPTISVNSTVASTGVGPTAWRTPVRNSRTWFR